MFQVASKQDTFLNYRRLGFLSLALSKKRFFIRVAYFNHAANLLKYFDKLLKINK